MLVDNLKLLVTDWKVVWRTLKQKGQWILAGRLMLCSFLSLTSSECPCAKVRRLNLLIMLTTITEMMHKVLVTNKNHSY